MEHKFWVESLELTTAMTTRRRKRRMRKNFRERGKNEAFVGLSKEVNVPEEPVASFLTMSK